MLRWGIIARGARPVRLASIVSAHGKTRHSRLQTGSANCPVDVTTLGELEWGSFVVESAPSEMECGSGDHWQKNNSQLLSS